MMFLPREGHAENIAEERTMIDLLATELKLGTYQLTAERADYDALLKYVRECAGEGDKLFLGRDWRTKEYCLVLETEKLAERLQCIQDKGIKADVGKIEGTPFMLTHEFITEKSEFEAIAETAAECAPEPDRLLVGDEELTQKHMILFVTSEPAARAECLDEKGIRVQIT